MRELVLMFLVAAGSDYPLVFFGTVAILALCPKPWIVLVSIPTLVGLNVLIILLRYEMRMTWHEFEADKLVSGIVAFFAAIALGMILRVVFRGPERMRRLELQ